MSIDELLKLTLSIYEEECHYLKEATINENTTVARFSVPATVYAVKGRKYHLNAVEVFMIYEQITYLALANLFINSKLEHIPVNVFFPTVVDEKVLIANFKARFLKQVNSHDFTATLQISKITKKSNGYWFDTQLDINSGCHTAEVKLFVDTNLNLHKETTKIIENVEAEAELA